MKTTKLWLTTIVALLCSFTASAHDFEVDGIYYKIVSSVDLTVTVTFRGSSSNEYMDEYNEALIIPNTVAYDNETYSVISIDDYAFSGCSSLTSIVIPQNVTQIGNYAFANCSSLKEISIENSGSALSLGYNVSSNQGLFYDCPLTEVYIGRNLNYSSGSSYGYSPFYNSNRFPVISLGDKVTAIPPYLFYGNTTIFSFDVPKNIRSIEQGAFAGCTQLYKVINYSNLTLSTGSSAYGNVAYYAKKVLNRSEFASVGDFLFRTSNEIHYLSGYIGENKDIVLPDSYNGASYRIDSYAFYGSKSKLSSITASNGVTSIDAYAFYGCSSLAGVTLPAGITSIGNSAFQGCSSLVSFTIPQGVSSISESLFSGCGNLLSVAIPESVTDIYRYAFNNCSSLSSITIPQSVTAISNYSFDACTSLKEIVFEDGDKTLSLGTSHQSRGLFYDCPLEKVYIGRNLSYSSGSSYGYSPFYNGTRFAAMSFGDKVMSIAPYLYYGDTTLSSISIPQGMTSIGVYAFYGCSNLADVTLPASVASIGNSAFDECCMLYKVINYSNLLLSAGSANYGYLAYYANKVLNRDDIDVVDDFLFITSDDTHYLTGYVGDDTEISLPNNYNGESYKIDDYAFWGCDNSDAITTINISNGVTSIGAYAFSNCNNLYSVTIGNGIQTIGDDAFCTPKKVIWLSKTPPVGCINAEGNVNYVANEQYTDLKNVSIYPYLGNMFEIDGVKYVPVNPSERTCDAIDCAYNQTATRVNVDETVLYRGIAMTIREIMPYTFYGNQHLKEVTVAHKGSIGDYAFYNCNNLQNAIVSNQNMIGNRAFYACVSLTTVTLGDRVKSIGSQSFRECKSLQEIIIPDAVEAVGEYCFSGCLSLEVVNIGEGVSRICNNTFQNCSLLTEVTIPQTVVNIGDHVFFGCNSLADVIFADRTETLVLGSNGSSPLFVDCPLDSVYIGGKITHSTASDKGYSPFYRNSSLRTVVIADSEEHIYDNEFYGCTNLQNVTIGNGVESIGNYAFSGCSSLDKFTFGSNMETIGEEAFSDCTNLTSMTSYAAVPPICETQALDDIDKWSCMLRVPVGNAVAYYAADQWKEFFFIEDIVEVGHYVLTYMVDGEVYHTETLKHKDEVTMLSEPTKVGYVFSGWDKTLTTMPAEDVVISGTFTLLPTKELVILDTEANFVVEEDIELEAITYTRNFKNTNWQALYVPFEIPYENIKDDFVVAYINDVHQFDDDDDGAIDRTQVEAIKVTGGVLRASYPYMIRAKVAGEKSITVIDATLYATEENSIDCSSVFDTYTFTGTYSKIPASELPKEEGYYALSGGSWKHLSANSSLGAFRMYMKIDSRDANAAVEARAIEMRVIGDDEEGATGIENPASETPGSELIYDLQGRRVENPAKGLYIVDGRKVWIE